MTPGELNTAVILAVRDAVADGEFAVPVPDRIPVAGTATGGYATPLALRLARAAERPALEIAALLAERLAGNPGFKNVQVTGPGFITIEMTGLTARIDEAYGVRVVPQATWPVHPLTFDNKGFAVRFAYARACGVRRHADDLGLQGASGELDHPLEQRLVGLLADFPGRAEQAAREDDSRPFTRHLEMIADAYHDVHERCPALPKGDEPFTTRHAARIDLARAVRIVLGNGLRMLGETPSDRL